MENSALVIIELYKIRTGTLMRDARAWFVSDFAPQSGSCSLSFPKFAR